MKYFKRTIQISAFLMGLIVILLTLSYAFMPKSNSSDSGSLDGKLNGILGEKKNTIDTIVIGDSETFSAISPLEIWSKTGYTTYVCGSVEQPLDYSLKVLKRAFTTQNPKIVILETNTVFREVSYSNTLFSKLNDKFSIFENNNRWKTLSLKSMFKKADYTWTDDNKGYYYSAVISASENQNYMIPTENCEKIAQTNRFIVKEIKEFCDANGAKLVLLSTPSTVNWSYEKHNSVAKIAKELNVEYIDLNLMNTVININWNEDTRDKGDHLNHSGAVKVSDYLCGYLKDTFLLTDHRNDAEFDSWNEISENYHEQVK